MRFVYQGLPSRVVFESGLARLPEEVAALGARRAEADHARPAGVGEQVAQALGERAAGVHPGAVMHVPLESAEAARAEAARLGADCCVAVGGGSTIGLGKAIALTSALPIVAVPTTYAGSEMTPIYGITDGGLKKPARPARAAAHGGLRSAADAGPAAGAVGQFGRERHGPCGGGPLCPRCQSHHQPDGRGSDPRTRPGAARRVADPADREARAGAPVRGWLAGACLGAVGMALHHSCATRWAVPSICRMHRRTPSLPHAAHYNHAAAPEALGRVRARSAAAPPRRPGRCCSPSTSAWACRWRCPGSACRRTAWNAPRSWRWRTPTTIRAPSPMTRCSPCSGRLARRGAGSSAAAEASRKRVEREPNESRTTQTGAPGADPGDTP